MGPDLVELGNEPEMPAGQLFDSVVEEEDGLGGVALRWGSARRGVRMVAVVSLLKGGHGPVAEGGWLSRLRGVLFMGLGLSMAL